MSGNFCQLFYIHVSKQNPVHPDASTHQPHSPPTINEQSHWYLMSKHRTGYESFSIFRFLASKRKSNCCVANKPSKETVLEPYSGSISAHQHLIMMNMRTFRRISNILNLFTFNHDCHNNMF